jgi:alkylation response protein AidB-like acyl-CoA dehydrogenase
MIMTELNKLINTFNDFEYYLGNPCDAEALITYAQILHDDELEQLNERYLLLIKNWGYFDFFIPQVLAGKFTSLQAIYLLTKVLARRDLTITIALSINFLASLPVWLAGSEALKKHHAQMMREGKISAFALTERAHGSDLSASDFSAQKDDNEWLLTGEKWCINYASQGDTITVLCKTHEQGGPMGFSLFYLDKQQLPAGFTSLNKFRTHGVRGLDISGFRLNKARLPAKALIGAQGLGLNIAYKSLQVSRLMCSSLVIGAADTALRLALQFSLERKLYNKRALDIPVVTQRLVECFCLQLILDCVAFSIVRAATVIPANGAIWSALIKYFSPSVSEYIVDQCGLVLGARGYLREDDYGLFQKISRDIQAVGLFDGSSEVNLYLLAMNIAAQAQLKSKQNPPPNLEIAKVFDFSQEIPAFNEHNIHLLTQQLDPVMALLSTINCAELDSYIVELREQLTFLEQKLIQEQAQGIYTADSLNAYRHAEVYCWLFAATCLINCWTYNVQLVPAPLQDSTWIKLSLDIILQKIKGGIPSISQQRYDKVLADLVWFFENNQLFSILPLTIAH